MQNKPTLFLILLFFGCGIALAQKNDDDGARRLAQLVNGERTPAGLTALAWDAAIAQAALAHAQRMAERGDLSHEFPGEPKLRERMAATGVRFNAAAENVAFDNDVDGAHTNLMRSPGHRANILSPLYNAIGVAVVWREGRAYVVEDFARKMADRSDAEATSMVLAAFNRQRRAAGLPAVRLARDLHAEACRMARADKVSTRGISAANATSLVAFTTFQPEELPSSVTTRLGEREIRSVAIGACFARTPSYPAGADWVVMAFYP